MAKKSRSPGTTDTGQTASPPDQAERDRIASELDVNMLVEAAAGTGKTTSLVARMVNLIREGKCTIDQIAAVTYTRKAAAELRSRFQVELEKASQAASGKQRGRLHEALSHVVRAYVGTIHSFCARLLRERPIEAEVNAAFQELDDPADLLLRRRAWDEHVARLIATHDPILDELFELGLEVGQLARTFDRFADYPDVDEWPVPDVRAPDCRPAIAALQAYVAHMETMADQLRLEPGNDKLLPFYRLLPRRLRQLNLDRPAELLAVLESCKELNPKALIQRNWPGGKDQAFAELDLWNQFARSHAIPVVQTWRLLRYQPVLRVIRPAIADYERLRNEAGGLNFQDLLLKTARLLRHGPTIRDYFRRRFTHLLVDEFQDTDPVQAEVMLLLTAQDPTVTDWRLCRPVEGSLFVVGDPKQSIYRFRRADIVTYNQVKQIIEQTGGRVVSLSTSFRTTAPLVDWINRTFADRFPTVATDVAPAARALQVGRVDEELAGLAGVFLMNVPGKSKSEALEYEAAAVARAVRHALDTARAVPRSRRELERGVSPIAQPGDFLIVTRNTANLSLYARALQELGIPHQVTGGTVLNELDELALLHTCLRAVVRPDDPVSLVAALRSDLFGISDQALYALHKAGGQFAFSSHLPETGLVEEDEKAVRDAFEKLQRYDRWLKTLPPAAAIEKVSADLGLPARAAAGVAGEVRAGCLAKAIELVRAAGAERRGMADLVDYLGELLKGEEKHDGISVNPPEAPVVRLMNLHKVKGLEAPIVFLCDPSGKWEHEIDLHIDRSGSAVRGYLAVHEPPREYGPPRLLACPQHWDAFVEAEKRFQTAEQDRLLYVAATRAGACLTIAQREHRNSENPWQFFGPALEDQPTHSDPGPQDPPLRPSMAVDVAEVVTAVDQRSVRWNTVRRATYATEALKKVSIPSPPPKFGRDNLPLTQHGAEWGERIHTMLETAMRQPGVDLSGLARSLWRERDWELDSDIDAEAPAQPPSDDIDLDQVIDEAVATVSQVQQSEIWKRAQSSNRYLVEVPIQFRVAASDAENGLETIRRGVLDLAFREPAGWVIVDYKTDNVSAADMAALRDYYAAQVQSYAKAWYQIVGEPIHELGILFTRMNEYRRVAPPVL